MKLISSTHLGVYVGIRVRRATSPSAASPSSNSFTRERGGAGEVPRATSHQCGVRRISPGPWSACSPALRSVSMSEINAAVGSRVVVGASLVGGAEVVAGVVAVVDVGSVAGGAGVVTGAAVPLGVVGPHRRRRSTRPPRPRTVTGRQRSATALAHGSRRNHHVQNVGAGCCRPESGTCPEPGSGHRRSFRRESRNAGLTTGRRAGRARIGEDGPISVAADADRHPLHHR